MVTQVIVLKCKECGNNFDTTATYNEHGQMMPLPQLYCDYCDYEIKFGKKQSVVKEEDDIDIGESPYCPVCESCGEEGCCSAENSLWKHDCKYGKVYARDVHFNEMIIDEFYKLFDENGKYLGCDGNPIEVVYNNAFNRTKEKYGKGN